MTHLGGDFGLGTTLDLQRPRETRDHPKDLWPKTLRNIALENRKIIIMKRMRYVFALSACLLAASTAPTPAQTAGILSLTALGFTNSNFKLGAKGSPALSLQVQVSSNLTDWVPLVSVTPFEGSSSLLDSESPGSTTRFYRGVLSLPPATIQYVGNSLVLVGNIPADYGPGAVVHFGGSFNAQVTADANGLYTLVLDASGLPAFGTAVMYVSSADGSVTSPTFPLLIDHISSSNPASAVPTNLVFDDSGPVEPNICTCQCCPVESLMSFANSFTPTDPGTELATGKLRWHFPVLSFPTRKLGFSFELIHASLVAYNGPVGNGFSDSYNMMIVQTSATAGQVITPDLRVYSITSTDGLNWSLPAGFECTLTLNTNLHRWTLTHYSGFEVQFYQGTTGSPGYPVAISEPNGNTTTLAYNGSGLLQSITTDLGQTQTLDYTTNGLLASFTDHLGRTWTFNHDSSNRLTQIITPATVYAPIPAGAEVIDTTLAGVLVTRRRTTTIGFTNTQYPSHITSITDDRGAVPQAWVYDAQGRVVTNYINGNPEVAPLPPHGQPGTATRAGRHEPNYAHD